MTVLLWGFFIDFFSFCSSSCKMYCKAFTVSTKVTFMLWSIISKCYHNKATLFQRIISNPAGLSCCCCFFSSHHCFEYHVCIYILGLKSLERSFVCQERFMICLMWSHNRRCSLIYGTWLWEKHTLRLVCIWSLFLSSENHIVWIHIEPFMSDHLNHLLLIISREARPPALQIFHTKKTPPPISNPCDSQHCT